MKKIYLISRTDVTDYDEYDAIVVIAKNPKEAKEYAFKEYHGDFTKGNVTCELIGTATKRQRYGEVLGSFNAG